MKKLLIAAGVLVLCIGGLLTLSLVRQGRDRRALAAYKAQMRAQGEWLAFEDAGYPFELETNADLKTFTNLASQLSRQSFDPGALDYMPYAGPGFMILSWKQPVPMVWPNLQRTHQTTWQALSADCDAIAPTLTALRAELEHPPSRFIWNYTNLLGPNLPRMPWVDLRRTAQTFAADTLVALHENDQGRVQTNLHVLTQTTQVCRDDILLVGCMIRVALAGLGLSVTAQAIPGEGWDEESLASLQRDWESVNIIDAVERAFQGERLFGVQLLAQLRQQAPTNTPNAMLAGFTGTGTSLGLKDRLLQRVESMYWRGHMDADELFYIQHHQRSLDVLRELQASNNWSALQERMQAQQDALDEVITSPLSRFQYAFSAVAIANVSRAAETTVRNETLRRIIITAIALKRFHLRYGYDPRNLDGLVPEFLGEVPVDPWSGKPFIYRLNYDGTTTLYSVGEDGVDDGGDCIPRRPTSRIDFWYGRDFVWPKVYTATNSAGE